MEVILRFQIQLQQEKKYNDKLQNQCARITVSTCYDLLNHYTLDIIIESYNYSETEMAKSHY